MEAHDYLTRLAEQLRQVAGFTATLRPGTPARLSVQNPVSTELSDEVLCSPDADGRLGFRWSWNAPIAPVDDIPLAVQRISHVLKAVGP